VCRPGRTAVIDGEKQTPHHHADNEMIHPRGGDAERSEGRQQPDDVDLRNQAERAIDQHKRGQDKRRDGACKHAFHGVRHGDLLDSAGLLRPWSFIS